SGGSLHVDAKRSRQRRAIRGFDKRELAPATADCYLTPKRFTCPCSFKPAITHRVGRGAGHDRDALADVLDQTVTTSRVCNPLATNVRSLSVADYGCSPENEKASLHVRFSPCRL